MGIFPPGASPIKYLRVKIVQKLRVNFTSFQKMNPMKRFFVEVRARITLKIQLNSYK